MHQCGSFVRSTEAKAPVFLIYQKTQGPQGVVLIGRSQALLGCNSSEC
jgi:hypothetical protein